MKNLDFESAICPVCRGDVSSIKYSVQYFNDDILPQIGVEPPYPQCHVVQCRRCLHHYASPQLSDLALDLYYTRLNSEYYIESDKSYDRLLGQHIKIVNEVAKRKPDGGRLLEIGCGYGYLLSLFDKTKWDCVGVEPFVEACQFASTKLGLSVINGYLDAFTFTEKESFDIIMLFDVMEHLKDSVSMTELVKYYLKPGGVLILGTGDIGSLNAKFGKGQWAYLTLREHLSFFSKDSINYLLNDFNSVDIIKVPYEGSRFKNSMRLLHNFFFRGTYNMIQRFQYPLTKFKVTRFQYVRYPLSNDHMIVIAQK